MNSVFPSVKLLLIVMIFKYIHNRSNYFIESTNELLKRGIDSWNASVSCQISTFASLRLDCLLCSVEVNIYSPHWPGLRTVTGYAGHFLSHIMPVKFRPTSKHGSRSPYCAVKRTSMNNINYCCASSKHHLIDMVLKDMEAFGELK